jgi:Tol biopolymer transport system component
VWRSVIGLWAGCLLLVGLMIGAGRVRSGDDQVLYLLKANRLDQAELYRRDLRVRLSYNLTPGANILSFAAAPDGEYVLYIERTSNDAHSFYRVSLTTGQRKFLMSDPTDAITPAWSPDGTQFVYDNFSFRSLYLVDTETMRSRQLFNHGGATLAFPDWSPNGDHIVLTAQHAIGTQFQTDLMLYTIADGSQQWLTNNRYPVAHPRFSPDGDRIIYREVRGGGHTLVLQDIITGETVTLHTSDHDLWGADWSNGGDSIIFQAVSGGLSHLYRIPAHGGEPRPLTRGDGWFSNPVWIPDPAPRVGQSR